MDGFGGSAVIMDDDAFAARGFRDEVRALSFSELEWGHGILWLTEVKSK